MKRYSLRLRFLFLIFTILVKCRILKLEVREQDMIRFLIRMGAIQGIRHKIAEERACQYYHDMGIGA